MPKISVVVVNFNEAEKVKKCLTSVGDFADEKIIVDLGSTDNIVKIASSMNAKLIHHPWVNIVEKVRNVAIENATGNWILILDPDEIVRSELINYLKSISLSSKYEAVNIPRKNIFFKKWLKHSNFWPDYQVRFFRNGAVKWETAIHSYPKIIGKKINLDAKEKLAICHEPYNSVEEFISRLNRYTNNEATLKNPLVDFFKRYIWHMGFLDGAHGLFIGYLMVIYHCTVWVKLWEKKK